MTTEAKCPPQPCVLPWCPRTDEHSHKVRIDPATEASETKRTHCPCGAPLTDDEAKRHQCAGLCTRCWHNATFDVSKPFPGSAAEDVPEGLVDACMQADVEARMACQAKLRDEMGCDWTNSPEWSATATRMSVEAIIRAVRAHDLAETERRNAQERERVVAHLLDRSEHLGRQGDDKASRELRYRAEFIEAGEHMAVKP